MPPKRVILVAVVFAGVGLHAAWKTGIALSSNSGPVDLAILALPIAIGLMRGRSRSRWWAEFWFFLYYLLGAAVLYLTLFPQPSPPEMRWLGSTRDLDKDRASALMLEASLLANVVTLHLLLRSEKSREFFNRSRKEKTIPSPALDRDEHQPLLSNGVAK